MVHVYVSAGTNTTANMWKLREKLWEISVNIYSKKRDLERYCNLYKESFCVAMRGKYSMIEYWRHLLYKQI